MREKKEQMKEYYISLAFMILSVIFWGYSFISTKIVLTELPPVSIAFFRQLIAAITLLCWFKASKALSGISLKDIWVIIASAFFGIVLYFVFENIGLQFTSASNASMIVAAVPVFTMVTEILFYKQRASLKMLLCILLSMTGVYLVISVNGKLDFSSSMFKGNVLVIGAMVCWVAYTMLNKKLSNTYSSVLITFYQTVAAIFLFIPFILPEVKAWRHVGLNTLLNLVYLGVCCSALAYFFYIFAAKRLGPTVSSAFLNLIPVASVTFGYFILGETLQIVQITGMLLVMLSLFKLSKT